MGLTASFLPKPVVGVNGSGMHTNVSISEGGKNLFWDPKGEEKLSKTGLGVPRSHSHSWQRHLPAAEFQRERLSPARSALRGAEPDQGVRGGPRLDDPHPHRQREAACASKCARSLRTRIRIWSCSRSSRPASTARPRRSRTCARPSATCPTTSTTRSTNFRKAEWTTKLLGEDVKGRYADLKQASADRCPRLLGTFVKRPEVQFHHEVYNQFLWNLF